MTSSDSSRYREIASALRERVYSGEFAVGTKLPSIATLQAQYDVPGLNTIRAAQQLLVREGLLQTKQGVGAFVVSSRPKAPVCDPLAELEQIRDQLDAVIVALRPQP